MAEVELRHLTKNSEINMRNSSLNRPTLNRFLLFVACKEIEEEERISHLAVYRKLHLALGDQVSAEGFVWNEAYLAKRSSLRKDNIFRIR